MNVVHPSVVAGHFVQKENCLNNSCISIKWTDMKQFHKDILSISYNRFEKRVVASKLKLVKSTMTSIETATTIPLPVAQMTPPSKVPHSPICSSPESIDAGFYDIEVGSNLTSNNASSINGDEYQLVSGTFFQPTSCTVDI